MRNLGEMIARNYNDLVRVGACITHSTTRARDLISETYLYLEPKGKQYPQLDLDFVRWFYRCLWYVSRARHLNYFKMYSVSEPLAAELADVTEEPDERLEQVEQFQAKLTGVEAVLFELIFVHGLTYPQITDLYKKYGELNVRSLQYISKPLKQKIRETWKR